MKSEKFLEISQELAYISGQLLAIAEALQEHVREVSDG